LSEIYSKDTLGEKIMYLLCGAFKNFFVNLYYDYVKNLPDRTKNIVGLVCIVLSMFVFVLCTKGPKKGEMVNSWFLFWVSLILFFVGVFYLTFA
jgi:hypothetical protein